MTELHSSSKENVFYNCKQRNVASHAGLGFALRWHATSYRRHVATPSRDLGMRQDNASLDLRLGRSAVAGAFVAPPSRRLSGRASRPPAAKPVVTNLRTRQVTVTLTEETRKKLANPRMRDGQRMRLRREWASSRFGNAILGQCRALANNLERTLDFCANGSSMNLSPPIQFRVEWADSQGMSPLLGCRPI